MVRRSGIWIVGASSEPEGGATAPGGGIPPRGDRLTGGAKGAGDIPWLGSLGDGMQGGAKAEVTPVPLEKPDGVPAPNRAPRSFPASPAPASTPAPVPSPAPTPAWLVGTGRMGGARAGLAWPGAGEESREGHRAPCTEEGAILAGDMALGFDRGDAPSPLCVKLPLPLVTPDAGWGVPAEVSAAPEGLKLITGTPPGTPGLPCPCDGPVPGPEAKPSCASWLGGMWDRSSMTGGSV